MPALDPGFIAQAAKDLYAYGRLTDNDAWIFHLWPPGPSALEASILKLFGPHAPIVVVLQIIASLALAWMFFLERKVLTPLIGLQAASIVPFGVLLFPAFRQYLLEPDCAILGETIAISSFFSSIFFLIISLEKDSIFYATVAGACLAIASYLRAQVELITLACTLLAIPLGVALLVSAWPVREEKAYRVRMVKMMFVFLVVGHILMIPWRVHNWVDIGSIRWGTAADLIAKNGLSDSEFLESRDGDFVVEGGGNLGCVLEPSYCGRNSFSDYITVFLTNFLTWESVKASLIGKYWFSSLYNLGKVKFSATNIDIFWNCILAFCIPLTFTSLVMAANYRWSAVLVWLVLSFCGYLFVVLSLVHFEVRYFFLPKFFFFQMAAVAVAVVWKQKVSSRSA